MTERIKKVLIANRGEGSRRVAHTILEMGMLPVVVFTSDDSKSLHANEGQERHEIKNYTNIGGFIEVAKASGVKLVHPGWGFSSEDPNFPKACKEAGLIFIGPSEMAMRQAGNKETAKEIARTLGIPVIESFSGNHQDIKSWAISLGVSDREDSVPIMLKAARAGGGNGNRLVPKLSALDPTLDKLEQNFPSNGEGPKFFAERFISDAHHVEVQLLGDEHGGLVHFGTRNCSIQLRYQKVVEEAPAPFIREEKEKELYKYALRFGEHVGYTNAGTVEFLMDRKGNIFFLEFNPRLQVEHRVTELITGHNLVRHQIEIAQGGHVPAQNEIKFSGSAIEARINAQKFHEGTLLPAGGVVEKVIFPKEDHHIVVDRNLYKGYEINLNYDPTQAKVAVWGANRGDAVRTLQKALKELSIEGVFTNIDFVLRVLSSEEFVQGKHSTTFFEEMLKEMAGKNGGRREDEKKAAAIGVSLAVALQEKQRQREVAAFPARDNIWRDTGRTDQMNRRNPRMGWRR